MPDDIEFKTHAYDLIGQDTKPDGMDYFPRALNAANFADLVVQVQEIEDRVMGLESTRAMVQRLRRGLRALCLCIVILALNVVVLLATGCEQNKGAQLRSGRGYSIECEKWTQECALHRSLIDCRIDARNMGCK